MDRFLEMASSSHNSAWFLEPLQELASSMSLEVDIQHTEDNNIQFNFNEDVEESLASSLIEEMMDNLGISNVVDDVDITTEKASSLIKLTWASPNKVTAAPIDPEEDDMFDDLDDDDEDEDEDESEPVETDEDVDGIPAKPKKGKGLNVLNNVEARKLIERLYSMACGEDMSHFPSYWQEMDRLSSNYRGMSGYKPNKGEESASSDVDVDTLLELAHNLGLEEAKKKSKKGWKEGYGGFLTAFMKVAAGKRERLEKLWTNLDDASMVEEMINIGQRVVQTIIDEREKRGMDSSSADGDDSSDVEDSAEETAADKQFHALVQYKEDSEEWEKVGESFTKPTLENQLEELTKNGVKRKCLAIHTLPNSKQETMEDLMKRLNENS